MRNGKFVFAATLAAFFAFSGAAMAFDRPAAAADADIPAGNAEAGAAVFKSQCSICHTLGKNAVGPNLVGVVGRPAGQVENFKYSAGNKNSGITWTKNDMFTYLEKPNAYVEKTLMTYVGLKDAQKRADVIAYLSEQK